MHDRARPRFAHVLAPGRARRVDVGVGVEHGEVGVVVDGGAPDALHEPVGGWSADAAAGVLEEGGGAHGEVVGGKCFGDGISWRRWLGGFSGVLSYARQSVTQTGSLMWKCSNFDGLTLKIKNG